jgi:hypothetical protein
MRDGIMPERHGSVWPTTASTRDIDQATTVWRRPYPFRLPRRRPRTSSSISMRSPRRVARDFRLEHEIAVETKLISELARGKQSTAGRPLSCICIDGGMLPSSGCRRPMGVRFCGPSALAQRLPACHHGFGEPADKRLRHRSKNARRNGMRSGPRSVVTLIHKVGGCEYHVISRHPLFETQVSPSRSAASAQRQNLALTAPTIRADRR